MKRLLSGAVAVVLIGSFSGAGPEQDRAPRVTPDLGSIEKRLNELEAKVRANQEALDQLARTQGQNFVLPPDFQPWGAPTPYPQVVPNPGNVDVYYPANAAIGPGRFDRCLITVDPAAFDSHFVVKMPEVNSRMIVAPRVRGLPAGSWPYGAPRP